MIEADGAPIMPLTDRRSFQRRAATLLAAGAAGTTTAIIATRPAPAATLPQEDPAIVAIGDRIEPLLVAYRSAAEDRLKARADAEASCPAVPEELVCNGPFWAGCTESECDVEGKEIWRGDRRPWQILHPTYTKAAIARGNLYCDRRTTFGKKLVKMIETAEKYEAAREAAIERSGLDDARECQHFAAWEIAKLAYETVKIEPQTMAGALIQARVLAAYAEVEIEVGHFRGRAGQLVGLALAQSVARLNA
jgi:hypothetical protein